MIGYKKMISVEKANKEEVSNLIEMNEGNYGIFSSYESNDLKLIKVFGESFSENNYKLKSNFN